MVINGEQHKPLEGGTWTTTALYLQGISLVRRSGEWHHFDPLGTAGVITNNTATVVSSNLYDVFGVMRYQQGSAETPWRWKAVAAGDEGLLWTESNVVVAGPHLLVNQHPMQLIPKDDNRRNCWIEYWIGPVWERLQQ